MCKQTLFLLFAAFCVVVSEERFTLKQVVILSRHGLRTPLSVILNSVTPRKWPEWQEKSGHLTEKGKVLEGYMGKYIHDWLSKEELFPKSCPTDESFYVYANTKQRTLASAAAFVEAAFPNCNITIHHAETENDPIFNPEIHNSSSSFIENGIEQMRTRLKMLSVNSSYEYMDDILDYNKSKCCLLEHKCDLIKDKNTVLLEKGKKPNLLGPIKICNSAIDGFIMQYYEGFATNDVAWGYIQNEKQWCTLMELTKGYHNVIFNVTMIARDISKPMVKYMSNFFLNSTAPKVALLMGHDANIQTVLNAMNFKSYILDNQFELIPISGKLVFQKWYDAEEKKNLLRIDFVYQSPSQLRDGTVLTPHNPPHFQTLELSDCKLDDNGFCPWNVFEKIVEGLL